MNLSQFFSAHLTLVLKVTIRTTEFLSKKLPYYLASKAGLAPIGKFFRRININAMVDTTFPIRKCVKN